MFQLFLEVIWSLAAWTMRSFLALVHSQGMRSCKDIIFIQAALADQADYFREFPGISNRKQKNFGILIILKPDFVSKKSFFLPGGQLQIHENCTYGSDKVVA